MENKIKKIITNQYFILAVITIVALLIRLLDIDKPSEFWRDELLTYVISSKSFPFGILKAIWLEDYHMPLYYFYVHGWMKLFGASDIVLRLSSVIWGVLTVPAFFYLGKIYRSKSLGYLLSIFASMSPILIYYSQEFRFYSMLIFFATLSVIFFLKLLDNPNQKDFWLFGFSNLFILYIYTMGIVFVGIEFLILCINTFLYKKEHIKTLVKNSIIFLLFTTPYFALLFAFLYKSNQALIEPFSWGLFNYNYFPILLNNWFSPNLAQLNAIGYNMDELNFLHQNKVNYFVLFSLVSTICFVIGFISTLENLKRKTIYLLTILMSFILLEMFLHLTGHLLLIVRYTMIIYPVLLLLCSDGFMSVKRIPFRVIIIGLILIPFTYNLINYKNMLTFTYREYMSFNHQSALKLLRLNTDKTNYILYSEDTNLLKKYMPDANFIDLDLVKVQQARFNLGTSLLFFDKQFILTTNKKNSADKLIPVLLNPYPRPELYSFLDKEIEKIPKNGHLIIIDEVGKGFKNYSEKFHFLKEAENNTETKKVYLSFIYFLLKSKFMEDIQTVIENNKSVKKIVQTNIGRPCYIIYLKK